MQGWPDKQSLPSHCRREVVDPIQQEEAKLLYKKMRLIYGKIKVRSLCLVAV